MPQGTVIELDPGTKRLADDVLFGGSPGRFLRLSPAGRQALAELMSGPVASARAARLARQLTDGGMAHPRPTDPAPALALTVVVPVRDRPAALARCLGALGRRHPVVVVDDGSLDAAAVAEAAAAHGARLARRPVPGGPAAARNFGLRQIDSPLVAFIDSDCEVPPDWSDRLSGYLADPQVVGAAPRIVGPGRRSLLDLGERPAAVTPFGRVPFVPTAALLLRRPPLGEGFDEELRYGEDVDLVWRLVEAGWRLRYDPAVEVIHHEDTSLSALAGRRFRYGTSVGPLARRHPGKLTHLVLAPGPTATVAALLTGRPLSAATTYGATVALLRWRLRRLPVTVGQLAGPVAAGVVQTGLGVGRWSTRFTWPALLALALAPGPLRRRLGAGALLAGPALADRVRWGRPVVDSLVDDLAYGLGVGVGCWRAGTAAPVVPVLRGIGSEPDRGGRRS